MNANGNRLPEHSDLDALLDNRLPFWGDRHYQYDAYGNLITIKRGQNQALVQALTYNAKHQLIELTETHHGQFHQKLIFDYDALGRRIWKKVYQQTPDQERYDRAEHTLWHGSQRIQTRYFSDKRRCIHHDITLYEPGSHTPLAILDNTLGLLDIDTDHLGTPKALYDRKTGDTLWHTDHTLYGQTTNNQSHNTHPKTGQPLDPKLRFQGQYEDLETGLYQNLNRYYDPHSGRYINHDPIGLMGGLNQYQYCPNPVEWIDPSGLHPWAWNGDTGMGHHLVPRGKANSIGLDLLGTKRNTPTYFPEPYEPGMHEDLHRAQKPYIGKLQGPWNGTAEELIEASKKGLADIDNMKGTLKIPATGETIASNVTPTEAFDHLIDWHNTQLTMLSSENKDCPKKNKLGITS